MRAPVCWIDTAGLVESPETDSVSPSQHCRPPVHGPLPGQVALGAEVGGGLRGIGRSFIVRAGHWERKSGCREACAPPSWYGPTSGASHPALTARPSLGATHMPGAEATGDLAVRWPSTPQAVT